MSNWGTNAEDFIGIWHCVENTTEYEIKDVPLMYYDAATTAGAKVSFDTSTGQLNIEGADFALKADGYAGNGKKMIRVVSSTPGGLQADGITIVPTEGERYEHEET